MIKKHKIEFAIPLSILFNQSIIHGTFPNCFKHANIIPIYKKGPKDDVNNYRPISLLNTFSKIFEKLMKINLTKYLDSKAIINPQQFGFRQGMNTFDALSKFSDEIYSTLDAKDSYLSIYIDFTKAFDTVRQDILLNKLQYYGIRGNIHNWFRDYLTNRTQSVTLFNQFSPSKVIKYGVPQGSVLGPILFLLYINDLPNIFKNFKTILFADDSTLCLSGQNPVDMFHVANAELSTFHRWCLSNRMTVNLTKTFYMFFTNKSINLLPPLLLNCSIIKKVTQHTLLGVTFDDTLTFKPHLSDLCLRLSRIISLLYYVKDIVPLYVVKILYNAHALPVISYCLPIWCNTYPTHLIPLFRLQKKILRIINNTGYYEHTQPLFKASNILTLFDLNKLYTGIHMFKTLNNYTSLLLPQHQYPTRSSGNLRVPPHNLSLYKHSLAYNGPRIWNSIPEDIKSSLTLRSFKSRFKNYLFGQYLIL